MFKLLQCRLKTFKIIKVGFEILWLVAKLCEVCLSFATNFFWQILILTECYKLLVQNDYITGFMRSFCGWKSKIKNCEYLLLQSRAFHRFGHAKFPDGGSVLGSSQFSVMPQLPPKTMLGLKEVKIGSTISNSLC